MAKIAITQSKMADMPVPIVVQHTPERAENSAAIVPHTHKVKMAHEMTLLEYAKHFNHLNLTPMEIRAKHKEIVERAIREGRPVPSHVLEEYPDIGMQARGHEHNAPIVVVKKAIDKKGR